MRDATTDQVEDEELYEVAVISGVSIEEIDSYYNSTFVAQHITDWMTVTDDELGALKAWVAKRRHTHRLICNETRNVSIKDILQEAKDQKAKEDAAREATRLARAEKAKAKRLKEEKTKRELFEKLKKELENT